MLVRAGQISSACFSSFPVCSSGQAGLGSATGGVRRRPAGAELWLFVNVGEVLSCEGGGRRHVEDKKHLFLGLEI